MLRLTIARDPLHTALSAVRRSADPKSTMPILAHVRLLPEAGALRLDASDLYQSATARVPAEIADASAGGVMVPARQLFDLLGKVPRGATVDLSWEGKRIFQGEEGYSEAHIAAWRTHHAPLPPLLLRAGPATFQIPTLDARNFPQIPELPRALQPVDGPALLDMLQKVAPTISTDETRYHLNGAMLCTEGGDFLAVSTDGHRLTLCRRARTAHALPDLGKAQLLIPRRSVLEIIQLLKAAKDGPVSFGLDKGHAFLVAGGLTLSAKLRGAQFPPHQQVIPRDHDRELVVGRAALLAALDQALLVAGEPCYGVTLGLNHGALRVRTDNPDKGELAIDLPARYAGSPFVYGVNAAYLVQALKALSGPLVTFQLTGDLDPLKIPDGAGGVVVIMSMRLYEGKGRTEWAESDPAVPPAAKSLPDLTPAAPPPLKVKPAARPAKKAPAATPAAEVADRELCDLCTALAERPLETRAACLAWLEELLQGRKAQASAPAGLRLVYSAPKGTALRQPQAATKRPAGRGRKGTGKAAARWQPTRQQIEAAGNWDW